MISIKRTGLPGRGCGEEIISGGLQENLGNVEAQADGTKLFSRGFCPTTHFPWRNRERPLAESNYGRRQWTSRRQ
ncbi:MAG: hypothetical protein E5X72_29105 [Mesorhizobium sp.]|uniref:hypothetical protein n=1 Tax=Mesorhizobium sp. TaxID=1871066 RepID=UPI001212DE2B|nr:hypothetical protein [Mesorhizobium sp.]TIP00616.1 MAG: hypothetical protein E5X72_29105 [Mesorhizobium sp.]TIP49572.1 MAG: hypothetical protein E5X77_10460 [Mesorhizobium sp.]